MDNKNMTSESKRRIVLLLILGICLLLYFFVPSINKGINSSIKTLTKLDLDGVINYIRSYGTYAAIISFLLMILQSIISPVPAFFITLANAAIFGWAKGALLSWSSAMVGAVMCFYISRILGRDVVEKIATKTALESVDEFFEKYGNYTILVCRLLPFISFDAVSYAAGLTPMSFWKFFVATGLGQLPATIIYSKVGELSGSAKTLVIGLLSLFALSVILYMVKKIYNDRQEKRTKKN
ncbi:MAG: TVP38/TMEM64 family protein [Lagierella massiliensis]|nr:TVP38/TMEM64 family protein [Lagierella massiliensis]